MYCVNVIYDQLYLITNLMKNIEFLMQIVWSLTGFGTVPVEYRCMSDIMGESAYITDNFNDI